MSKVHQICPVCAACNTKQKDGYYTCCGCRHKWRDVKSSSVFDHITQSVETLAEKLVYKAEISETLGGLSYSYQSFVSTIIPDLYFEKEAEAIAATVEELKKEWKSGKDTDVPANPTDIVVGSMEEKNE